MAAIAWAAALVAVLRFVPRFNSADATSDYRGDSKATGATGSTRRAGAACSSVPIAAIAFRALAAWRSLFRELRAATIAIAGKLAPAKKLGALW